MKTPLTALLALLFTLISSTAIAADVIDHEPFDELLSEYVDSRGRVAYARLKADAGAMKALDAYLDAVASADVDEHADDAKLAFYINAYNAHVIDELLDRWPVENPLKVPGFFKKIEHRIAGDAMTLDELEHGLIRKRFEEPRIHFVLNCAARSCPRLRPDALTASRLERDLEASAREFIPAATRLAKGKVVTSQLFNWFAEDFIAAQGSVAAYLSRYVDGEVRAALKSGDVEITFSEYDWRINKR